MGYFADAASLGGAAVTVERPSTQSSVVEILDRVLDKGIVIDAWVRVSLVGIELITIEARVVVASIETHLEHSEMLDLAAIASARRVNRQAPGRVAA